MSAAKLVSAASMKINHPTTTTALPMIVSQAPTVAALVRYWMILNPLPQSISYSVISCNFYVYDSLTPELTVFRLACHYTS